MSKRQSLAAVLTAQAIALGTQAAFTQPSYSATVRIACAPQGSTPTITANFSKLGRTQNITMLSFLSKYFSPKDAMQNCETTAKTLQTLYNTGNIKYLSSDTLQGQPVVCAVERRGIGCDSDSARVLFTLDQKSDPSKALYDMLGSDFKQSPPPALRTVSRIYTDIKPSWWPF